MFLTTILYLILLVVLFLIYGIHRYILDKRYRLPPGPPPLPFFGNIFQMSDRKKPWVSFYDMVKDYGSVVTFYMGQTRMIILNGSDVVHDAIVTQGKTFSPRGVILTPGFGDLPTGVLFASGEVWRRNRRFALKALRDFGMGKLAIVDQIHDEAGYLLAEMDEQTFRPFNPRNLLTQTVSNVICRTVFGNRFQYGEPKFTAFLNQLNKAVSGSVSRRALYFVFPFIRHFSTPAQMTNVLNMAKIVTEMTKEAIAEHRKDFNNDHIRDFPDLFIQAELTKDAIDFDAFSLVMTDMFAGGTETTTTALNWSLLYLATYPDVQRRCHDAIDRQLDTDRLPTLSDRPNLVYVDAFMYEVLRHATILPLGIMHSNMDEKATIAGYEIPPRSVVSYNIWALHHDPAYWTKPERFNPDRWIDPDGKLLAHASHFMPFGAGPRICLGELLARVEYFIFLVALLHRFTFALADPNVSIEDGVPGLTNSPPNYRLVVSKR